MSQCQRPRPGSTLALPGHICEGAGAAAEDSLDFLEFWRRHREVEEKQEEDGRWRTDKETEKPGVEMERKKLRGRRKERQRV